MEQLQAIIVAPFLRLHGERAICVFFHATSFGTSPGLLVREKTPILKAAVLGEWKMPVEASIGFRRIRISNANICCTDECESAR
ncbi:unnamed protein product [Nesidiocoris tenuis]|uniref:Uncharacterized protein n=1 Tax=Nesidiocoris tenuis TaxID=355587 RepID=A0A6H5HE79_9HEMI|nr:unnamed protein product [Nesidiocoris tenuis]